MTCEQCGAAMVISDSNGGTNPGDTFTEYWECANGHTGTVSGTVGDEVQSWNRSGPVFTEY